MLNTKAFFLGYPIISFEARSIWVHKRFKTSTIEHEEGTPHVGGGLRRVGRDRAMARTRWPRDRFRRTKPMPLASGQVPIARKDGDTEISRSAFQRAR